MAHLPTPAQFARRTTTNKLKLVDELSRIQGLVDEDAADAVLSARQLGVSAESPGALERLLSRHLSNFRLHAFESLLADLRSDGPKQESALRLAKDHGIGGSDAISVANQVIKLLDRMRPDAKNDSPKGNSRKRSVSAASSEEQVKPTDPSSSYRSGVTVMRRVARGQGYLDTLKYDPILQRSYAELVVDLGLENPRSSLDRLVGHSLAHPYCIPSSKQRYRDSGSGVEIIYFGHTEEEGVVALHLNCWKMRWNATFANFSPTKNMENMGLVLHAISLADNQEIVQLGLHPAVPRDYISNDSHLDLFNSGGRYSFSPTGIMRTLNTMGLELSEDCSVSLDQIAETHEEIKRLQAEHDALEDEDELDHIAYHTIRRAVQRAERLEHIRTWEHSLSNLKSPRGGAFDQLFQTLIPQWTEDLISLMESEDFSKFVATGQQLEDDLRSSMDLSSPFMRTTQKTKTWSSGFRGASRTSL